MGVQFLEGGGSRRGSSVVKYLVVLILTALAAAMRWAMPQTLEGTPFLVFYPVVVVSAALGGAGPGLVATLGGAVCYILWFDPQHGDGYQVDVIRTLMFLGGGAGVALLADRLRALSAHQRRQKELLAVTLSSIGDGVIVTDNRGAVTFLNGEAERLTGWKVDEAAGQPLSTIFNIVNEHTRQVVENPVEKVLRLGTVVGLANHTILIAKDGTETPIDDSGAPVRSADGAVHGVVLVFRDFSERKAAESALSRSEQRLRAIYDNAGVGILEAAEGDRLIGANRRACEILGRSQEELLTMSVRELTAPEDRDTSDRLNRELHGGERSWFDYEKRYLRGDGSRVWVHVTVSGICDAEGRWVRSIATVEDISQRKAAETALLDAKLSTEQALDVAEKANKAKDHFLAVLSHELRTPLTPVLTTASMLEDDRQLPQHYREDIAMIRRNIELEARLIDDLLDVTRIVRGKTELDRRPVALSQIIRRAVEVCRSDIEGRGLRFQLNLDAAGSAVVHADAARLQQVFWNLLKNAIKFTPQGGNVWVRSSLDPARQEVITEIVDSGVGIEPEVIPRLFKAFEQGGAGTTRQFGGLGLGLAITKGLVEMHGGSIQTHSDGRDKGACFTVRLPLCDASPASETPTMLCSSPQAAIDHRKLRILLVEDHGDTARIMKRLLTARGCEVQTAGDVAGALNLASGPHRFDLLISDLGLPDGSGTDLIRELRRRGHTIPAIAVSGYGQEEDVRRSREAGFSAHLIKPTSVQRLAQTIAAVTARNR